MSAAAVAAVAAAAAAAAPVLGAGNFGLVVEHSSSEALKLFYTPAATPAAIETEARIQTVTGNLLHTILKVPRIHRIFSEHIQFDGTKYISGLLMDRVPTPAGFTMPVHIVLGLADDHPDIDQPWGRDLKCPPSPDNPPRGFHAGAAMMDAIWADEGRTDITVDSVAYTMGKALATCVRGGIIPLDIEFIYGGEGAVYMIDFGLCEEGTMDPWAFFHGRSSQTLGVNYYVPRPGMRGYSAFYDGYTAAAGSGACATPANP